MLLYVFLHPTASFTCFRATRTFIPRIQGQMTHAVLYTFQIRRGISYAINRIQELTMKAIASSALAKAAASLLASKRIFPAIDTTDTAVTTLWLQGDFVIENGKPKIKIWSHGQIEYDILYTIHLFRDAEARLLQLGRVNEACGERDIRAQGWAGCLAGPRGLYKMSKPVVESARNDHRWTINEKTGTITTNGADMPLIFLTATVRRAFLC
ncbi:hypothetical protein BJ875DRAFT_539808 [Amylocarpus encephaloides]|uniref:Uncharacterized protein n=1 Tax=Amylocarpus encephaloides TaxID=45428 RepID=A0A9P7YQR5_9HELO|nr:hypothetical protein BJ875DRAFT_539808 [Amylocarpus encephaloides]